MVAWLQDLQAEKTNLRVIWNGPFGFALSREAQIAQGARFSASTRSTQVSPFQVSTSYLFIQYFELLKKSWNSAYIIILQLAHLHLLLARWALWLQDKKVMRAIIAALWFSHGKGELKCSDLTLWLFVRMPVTTWIKTNRKSSHIQQAYYHCQPGLFIY